MRIVVLSDTHGILSYAQERIELLAPDTIIHLGDYTRDADMLRGRFPGTQFYSVCGNCDRNSSKPEELTLNLCGHKIFAAHGHRQGVKDGIYGIYFAGLDNEADIALFGHTHIPYNQEKDGILLLNPGSAGSETPTFAILTLEIGRYNADIIKL